MTRRVFFPVGFSLALNACAVLNIDVDVYKGPLANHEDVQLEQMAAMAIGAKPLLMKLCQSLESEKPIGCENPGIELKDERAKLVRTVLSLYHDLYPQEIANLVNEVVENFGTYGSVYGDLRPGKQAPLEEDGRLWSDIQPVLWDLKSPEDSAIKEDIQNKKVEFKKVTAALQYLKSAYEKFLLSGPTEDGKRDIDLIYCGHAKLYEALGGQSEIWLKDLNPAEPDEFGLDGIYSYMDRHGQPKPLCNLTLKYKERDDQSKDLDPTSANAEFQVLLNKSLVETHSKLLFKPGTEIQMNLFNKRVKKIGHSFFEARQAQVRMMEAALGLINQIHAKPGSFGSHGEPKALLRVTARLAVELIRPRYIWYALENESLKDKRDHRELRTRFKKELLNSYDELYGEDKEIRRKFERTVMDILVNDPSGTYASILLNAHHALQKQFTVHSCQSSEDYRPCKDSIDPPGWKFPASWSSSWQNEYKADDAKWEHPTGYQRKFGISVSKDPADLREVASTFQALKATYGGPLDRGRLLIGLDFLTENYLTLRSKTHGEERLLELAAELHRELVGFAEKVLFLANNLPLFEEKLSCKQKIRKLFPCSDSRQNLDPKYGQILQAVGNSILGQADELRQNAFHKKTLSKQAHAEIEAFRASLSPAASTIFQTLISGLQADIDRSTAAINSLNMRKADLPKRKVSSKTLVDEKISLRDAASLRQATLTTAQVKLEERVARTQAVLTLMANSNDPASDSVRLQAHLAQKFPSSDISPQNLLDEIGTWLSSELSRYTTDSTTDRSQRLSIAKQYLEEIKAYVTTILPAKPVLEALNQLRDSVRRDLKEAEEALDQSNGQLADATQKVEEAKQALAKAEGELATIEKELSTMPNALEAEAKTTAELNEALTITRNHAKTVLERGLSSETTGGNAFDEFLASIDVEMATKTEPDKTKWQNARALLLKRRLDNRTELVDRLIDKTTEPKPNSKEVFDNLIALLRHEYIQEVKKNGKDGGLSPQIEAALKSAWDLRTSFVYIRPAGAYLRSSYPTPSLQDDPALAWNNMLVRTTFRGTPVIGKFLSEPCFPFFCKADETEPLIAEFDKHFWQNINKVRVTGGGYTNYVIAKDDIGNWSVKEVATDPEDIIKGAKSLALFGFGSSSGLPLLTKRASAESVGSTSERDPNASGKQAKTQLQSVYEKYQAEYEQGAATAIEELKKEVVPEGIPHKIQVLWEGNQSLAPHVTQLKSLLGEARKSLDEALKSLKADSDATKSERPSRILSGVKAIHRFHNELRDGIKALHIPPKPELAESAESSALQAVTSVCQESLTRLMKGRQEANKSYETSILFIGEVVKSKRE